MGTGGEGQANADGWNFQYYQNGFQPTIYKTSPYDPSWAWPTTPGPGKMLEVTTFSASIWHHLAWSRISSSFSGYIDGEQVFNVITGSRVANSTHRLEIGKNIHSVGKHGRHFDGDMSSIKIYKNKGLTQKEVSQNFNAHRSRFGV